MHIKLSASAVGSGFLIYTYAILIWAPQAFAEQQRPKLMCHVVFSDGSFFGYGPPEVGSQLTIDLNRLDGHEGILRFGPDSEDFTMPYIPLPSALVVQDEVFAKDGRLERARWVGESVGSSREARKLILDFSNIPGAGQGPNYYRLWIIDEIGSIGSVAKANCLPSDQKTVP